MRRVFALALCLLPAFAAAQPPQVDLAVHQARWSYPAADLKTYSVTHFKFCVDALPCADIAPTAAAFTDAQTPSGSVSYSVPFPALTMGSHAFTVRACNSVGCGPTSAPFDFSVLPVPATAPTALGIVVR